MLQYISYLQLCSNVLQNKLSRRQQKYIVNVYKNCTAFMGYNFSLYEYWLCSVFFSSYVLRKRNEMPKIKGKKKYIYIYKPHGFYSIKNTVGKVLSLRYRRPRPGTAGHRRAPPPAAPARRRARGGRAANKVQLFVFGSYWVLFVLFSFWWFSADSCFLLL